MIPATRSDKAYRCVVDGARPNPAQWVWYALGGGLPRRLSPWVLDDVTRRSWVVRHLARALVQLAPVIALCLVVAPVPFSFRLSAAAGGLLMGLLFSLAYMTETTEHRAVKAGWPPGTTARLRAERVERDQLERRAEYRQGGSGSFD
ncbi:MAG: uncharacterized protein JWR62_1771 [Modestobacter sp.]|nr:uncharacterized protein [Modestobacter sp.]